MKLDILAIGVHPDDVELSCSGTILRHIHAGYTCGICDLTQGEMGTRGNAQLRLEEAKRSQEILGVSLRVNLGMADAFFTINEENIRSIAKVIRTYRPEVVFANAPDDRHPDHGRASKLVSDACFYSGLSKIIIHNDQGEMLSAWRPNAVYHYIQDRHIIPDFVVDISPYIEKKFQSIAAFSSQFYTLKNSIDGPQTPISSESFLEFMKTKNRIFGRDIGVEYAEGFKIERAIGVDDVMRLK